MKFSFETVVLVFVVTLIHIAAIALLSPVERFEWGTEAETPEVEQLIEDAISISEKFEVDAPNENSVSTMEPGSQDTKEVAGTPPLEEAEPVALVNSNGFRERLQPPELAEARQEEPVRGSRVVESSRDEETQADAQVSSSRELRQITPIPRS